MCTGLVRVFRLRWIVFIACMLQSASLTAETAEERLAAIEQRLSSLERNLDLLLQKISGETPGATTALEQTRGEVKSLTADVKALNTSGANPPPDRASLPSVPDAQLA